MLVWILAPIVVIRDLVNVTVEKLSVKKTVSRPAHVLGAARLWITGKPRGESAVAVDSCHAHNLDTIIHLFLHTASIYYIHTQRYENFFS